MTVVLGLVTENMIIMGADSRTVRDGSLCSTQAYPKVREIPLPHGISMAIGHCGTPRLGQLLEYNVAYPAHADGDAMAYICRDVIPAIRTSFRSEGYLQTEEQREYGGWFLIGYAQQLFQISPDFSVTVASDGLAAIGSGSIVALGAACALRSLLSDPHDIVLRSLQVAAELDPYVGEPFVIMELSYETHERPVSRPEPEGNVHVRHA